jgi:hypothetical protein
MDCCQVIITTNYFLLLLFPMTAFFLSIPGTAREYEKWKRSRLAKHLSTAITLGTLSLYLLLTFYLICMKSFMRLTEITNAEPPLRVLVLIGFILVANYLLIPQAIKQYGIWKDRRQPKNFSLMALFGFVYKRPKKIYTPLSYGPSCIGKNRRLWRIC